MIYKKFIGSKPDEKISAGFLTERKKPRLAEKISVWIRGNFFIPDARKFWVKPSVRFLSSYLKSNKADAIISTGTPHSMHLIALALKKKFNISKIKMAIRIKKFSHLQFLLKFSCIEPHHYLEKMVNIF